MRNFSRRAFIQSVAAGLAAPSLIRPGRARAEGFRPLVLPALDPGRLENGRRVFDLAVARGQAEFFAGQATDTIGINAPFLGPVLTARAGDQMAMRVTNRLDEATSLHWHGLHLPAAADGGPHQPISPGETWAPEFKLMQKAGTFWFHAHHHGKTGAHVWAGMAGVLQIADDEEAALPLPRTWGEDDFTLILQDRSFDAGFQMPYAVGQHERMAGMQGERMMVNGQFDPILDTDAPRIRLRILNGSNGAIYRLHFADDRTFTQIASDGGLLPAPAATKEALMAPGERIEIILDLHDGAPALMRAELFTAEAPFMGSSGIRDFMQVRPKRPRAAAPAMPDRLAELAPALRPEGGTRKFVLEMSDGGLHGDPLINGQSYDHGRIDFTVPLGVAETWVFENRTDMLHPMHIHDVQFRILSRNGVPPAPREAGLKDVVLVAPGESVELAARFTDYADADLPYMMHCHILEHEDAGMMAQFTVV